MTKAELVLELGLEGGGLSVYRTPTGSGAWQFHVAGSTIDLDENDDEAWRSWGRSRFQVFPKLCGPLPKTARGSSFSRSRSTRSIGQPCGNWPRASR